MFGMAGETDSSTCIFNLFGIPVRVHPLFWLMAEFYLGLESGPARSGTRLGILCCVHLDPRCMSWATPLHVPPLRLSVGEIALYA